VAALLLFPSLLLRLNRREGQVLYLEHSVESLARGGPWLLGTIVPGISRWRVLKEAETQIHGGSSRRRLYGCAVTMLREQAPLQAEGPERLEANYSGSPVFEQQLLAWSQVSTWAVNDGDSGIACLGWMSE
jgi:hypothetical protein